MSHRYAGEYLCMFWDRAPCHQSGALEIPDNIWLEKLPAYCPDLNPQESIWDDMRESFFHNSSLDSMDAVETRLITAARFYESNQNRIQSITGWKWIISTI